MEITKESIPSLFQGTTKVGTAAVQISPDAGKALKGVLIKSWATADDPLGEGNNSPIFIGTHPHITADDDPNTGGLPLSPGSSLVVPLEDPSKLYAVSSGSNQTISWMVL